MMNIIGRLVCPSFSLFAASLLGLASLPSSASANDAAGIQRSFDIPNSTSSFVLGNAPTRAFVEGAPTAFVGDFSLYNTSFYAWLIDPGVQGTITFETPVNQLSFFARREFASVVGSIELLDANGNVVLTSVPDATGFEQIFMPTGSPQIAQIRVTNTGTMGRFAIDDIDYCAVLPSPPIGEPICGPAVPNSAGLSATLRAAGSTFVQANQVELLADGLPTQSTGFLLGSTTQAFVTQPGGSQGNLCLGGSIGRFVGSGEIMNSGLTGSFSLRIDLTSLPTPTGPVGAVVGETWAFQAWYRDVVSGASTSNLTDAIEVQMR